MRDVKFLVMGDTKEKRFHTYTELLKNFNIPHQAIDYVELINGKAVIPEVGGKVIVRLCSPWYNSELIDYFHQIGKDKETFDYEIKKGDDFYSSTPKTTNGFLKFLETIDSKIKEKIETPLFVNPSNEIYMGRNKILMYKNFEKKSIPHPKTYLNVRKPAEIFNLYNQSNHSSLFVKIHSGSLGRGIAIIDQEGVYTATKKKNGRFFSGQNIKKLKTDSEIEETLQFLLDMYSVVQEGINLAKINKKNFDFRHYVSHDHFTISILRVSKKKVTNEAMGGEIVRGEDISNYLRQEQISRSKDLATKAFKGFESLDLAIDIGFDSEFNNAYCLEVNFLPGLNYPEKPYTFEIQRNLEMLGN
ncbi:hypothetical protein KY341_05835, partial [Candidatus Woesearchaeota archaeon]|nr:hypothetical protein [Candidatus Woesearchaeota archaeon]